MTEKRRKELESLMEKLEISVTDYTEINSSLTHPSFVFEKDASRVEHNQRMEFLGDAVVGLVIAEYLYHRFPEKKEGELTKMRAAIVCEPALAESARQMHLGRYIQMGKGERLGGGEQRSSNLADAWEALVGALYLQLGVPGVRHFILTHLQKTIESVAQGNYGDFKTRLQELIQKNPDAEIEYQIIEEKGPDHDKVFQAGLFINSELISKGEGKTKKEAEQLAAKEALLKFGEIN